MAVNRHDHPILNLKDHEIKNLGIQLGKVLGQKFANKPKEISDILKNLETLTYPQIHGVVFEDLTLDQVKNSVVSIDQVETNDLGLLLGTKVLIESGKAETVTEALNMIEGLNFSQIHGMAFENLTRDEVNDIDFGAHTVNGMKELKDLGLSSSEAFNELKGSDANEAPIIVAQVSSSLESALKVLAQFQTSDLKRGLSRQKKTRSHEKHKKSRQKQ